MEEIEVSPGCEGEGMAIGELRGGAHILAVKQATGTFLPLPSGDERLAAGDILMAMGTARTMDRLEALFDAPAVRA